MMKNITAIILAAGKGSRMQSNTPKPLHVIGGISLLEHALRQLQNLQAKLKPSQLHTAIVHSPKQDELVKLAEQYNATPILQAEARGTAHALQQCQEYIGQNASSNGDSAVLVLFGDTPFVSADLMVQLLQVLSDEVAVSIGVFEKEEGGAYGRVLTNSDGMPEEIIEAKDASPEQLQISLCNGGCMAITKAGLGLLAELDANNKQQEYMLPHIVAKARAAGLGVSMTTAREQDFMGVNSPAELAICESIFQHNCRQNMLAQGVRMVAPETVFFSADTRIAINVDTDVVADIIIEPYVYFSGRVDIAAGVHIRAFSYIEGAEIGEGAVIGPFARIRPHSQVGREARIGNFVEIKNSQLGEGVKASHLSYLGDSLVGDYANIGAGVITCNYDGKAKHQTTIGAGAFVGANAALIAPVAIGKAAQIAALTAVTDDVGEDELAIARTRQSNRRKG